MYNHYHFFVFITKQYNIKNYNFINIKRSPLSFSTQIVTFSHDQMGYYSGTSVIQTNLDRVVQTTKSFGLPKNMFFTHFKQIINDYTFFIKYKEHCIMTSSFSTLNDLFHILKYFSHKGVWIIKVLLYSPIGNFK